MSPTHTDTNTHSARLPAFIFHSDTNRRGTSGTGTSNFMSLHKRKPTLSSLPARLPACPPADGFYDSFHFSELMKRVRVAAIGSSHSSSSCAPLPGYVRKLQRLTGDFFGSPAASSSPSSSSSSTLPSSLQHFKLLHNGETALPGPAAT